MQTRANVFEKVENLNKGFHALLYAAHTYSAYITAMQKEAHELLASLDDTADTALYTYANNRLMPVITYNARRACNA